MRSEVVLFLSLALVSWGTAACGDEKSDAPPGPCSSASLELTGDVAEIEGTLSTAEASGFIDSTMLALALGEVEFTPAGGTPEMRPRILAFQTNTASPSGRELLITLDERVNSGGMDSFEIVSRDIDSYCDVGAGQICARFGLDDNHNEKLISDHVVHEGISGTFKIVNLSSSAIAAEWDVEFGPNLPDPFDDSSGHLTGCLRATYGQPNNNRYTLR